MRDSISGKVTWMTIASAPALALAAALVPIATQPARAQTLTVLYTFTGGTDGGTPLSTPLLADGNVYGTASSGGAGNNGTVYVLNFKSRTETVLHSFTGGRDGADPIAGLLADKTGIFYGVTYRGGVNNHGTIYRLTSKGGFNVVHSFEGAPSEGSGPAGALILDPLGDMFGTTYVGGSANGYGTVFEVVAGGTYETVRSFPPGGALPRAGLKLVGGKLYGTTTGAGVTAGTVFEVGVPTAIYTFTGGADGAEPLGSLITDSSGNLYGATSSGGSGSFGNGYGVVFKLDPTTGQETVLHTFTGPDGSTPAAELTPDSSGNLYGTTTLGGANGYGTVFKLDPSGNLTTVYSFTGGADGGHPYAGVIVDAKGNVWGAASAGGSTAAPGGYGTLFIITPPAS
jgi:uncharacterized repeat protein (TIGR03803 family)